MSKAKIYWVGKCVSDPFRDGCPEEFSVQDFDNLYDAASSAMCGTEARILILNAFIANKEFKAAVKTFLSQKLFDSVYIYNPAPKICSYNSNGDPRVTVFLEPDQLFDKLHEEPQREVISQVKSALVPEPPKQDVDYICEISKIDQQEKPKPTEPPKKEFHAAELSNEELQALLGSEFKTEKKL